MLKLPFGVAADGKGNVYVANWGDHRIVKIGSDGLATVFAGSSDGSDDGPVATARFRRPLDLKFDSAGNLFVADQGSHCIRVVEFGTPRESAMPVSGVVGSPAAIAPLPDASGIVSVSLSPRP